MFFSIIAGLMTLIVEDVRIWFAFEAGLLFLVYSVLKTVLGADESYCIRLQDRKCNIYVYNRHGADSSIQDIIFRQEDSEAHVWTKRTSLGEKGYRFCKWDDFSAFMYCINGNNNQWFYLSASSNEAQFLGKKLTFDVPDGIFLSEVTTDKKLDLCVLHEKSVKHIYADSFVLGNAYVPPNSEDNICAKEDGFWVSVDAPEDYLIVKNNGAYEVYGLADTWVNTPKCQRLNVPVIIFQEAEYRVILQGINGEYKELYRMLPATRWVNNVIAERDEKYHGKAITGGTVWEFDENTLKLKKLYQGAYRALGFADGSIIGDGWEYTPENDNGREWK